MLKRAERLSREQFAYYGKAGKKLHGEHASINRSHSPTFHASVVVSKKVAKSAVVRNTLRRLVYAQLYALKVTGETGVFIIFLKPGAAAISKAALRVAVAELIERTLKAA
ncbi:MAG: ribonuclease P protein component [Patescibacteria group bacterium]